MKSKTQLKIALVLLTLMGAAGCRDFVNPFSGEKPIAKAGGKTLYFSDVESIFTPGLMPEDSVKLLESYIDVWVRKQLKVKEAERIFSESGPDIDRMVEEYRNSLLTVKLDNYQIDRQLDTTFTAKEIEEYYNGNRTEFALDRAIIRGRIVKLPDSDRQKAKVKELLKWGNEAQKQDFLDMCQKNGFEFRDFASWTDFSDLLAKLPADKSRDNDKILAAEGVQEFVKDGMRYYFIITERRRAGDAMPLERAQGLITKVLTNRRRTEIIRSYEDSIYNAAKQKDLIEINVK